MKTKNQRPETRDTRLDAPHVKPPIKAIQTNSSLFKPNQTTRRHLPGRWKNNFFQTKPNKIIHDKNTTLIRKACYDIWRRNNVRQNTVNFRQKRWQICAESVEKWTKSSEYCPKPNTADNPTQSSLIQPNPSESNQNTLLFRHLRHRRGRKECSGKFPG